MKKVISAVAVAISGLTAFSLVIIASKFLVSNEDFELAPLPMQLTWVYCLIAVLGAIVVGTCSLLIYVTGKD